MKVDYGYKNFDKLFAFRIGSDPMDWIIDSEIKIQVAIHDHIQFHCFSLIPPKIPLQTLFSPPSHITESPIGLSTNTNSILLLII